ncbi:MAG: hypothetical protein KTV72_03860 [Wolbachia endosymbiont of Melophagus ovinus]|nr:hypothetical protein [Wolbachia endosymbiont of Melophagus ovinus]
MLNANNEINIKKEERKHSWSTVFAWLYLKTIGRILPKRWNRWAENILYYDKATANNEVQTDAFKTVDESAQVDLKPEVAEKESQSEIMSKDGGVQTDEVAFQDTAMQTECVEKIDKNIEADLKPEVAEKDGGITSEDEGIYSEVSGGPTDEDCFDIEDEDKLAWDNDYKVYREGDEALQLDDMSQELELECSRNALLQKINEDLESKLATSNEGLVKAIETIAHLKGKLTTILEENKQLKLQLAEYKKDYTELKNVSDQIEKELSVELEENLVEMRKKDEKISSLTRLNKALEQDKKAMQDKVDEQQKTISDQEKRTKEQDALIKSLTDKNEAVKRDNESLRMQIMGLESKISELKGKISDLGREKGALQSNVNTLTAQLQSVQESKQRLEEEKSNIKQQKQAELGQTICKNAELESKISELRKEKAQFEEQFKAMEEKRKAHKENQRELENRLKNLGSQLSTAINKEKSLENDVAELQKQVQTLRGNKEWELAGIDGILKETFLTIIELLAQQLLLNNQEQSVKEQKLEELTLSYNDQTYQIADLQAENLSLRKEDGELLYRSINQIKKLEGALKEKDAQCKQLKESLCALESLESQSTTTKKAQQQRDSSHQTNTKSMAKSEVDLSQKNKGRLDKQLQKTKKEPVEQPNEKLTPNTFMSCTSSTARLKNNLTAEKKASVVKKRTNNPYNEKFVQSYTNSLPEDALEKSIKTKAKSLDSSNVQKLAKNISNEFTLPKNTNSTPNSFLSHTSSTASINSLNVRVSS